MNASSPAIHTPSSLWFPMLLKLAELPAPYRLPYCAGPIAPKKPDAFFFGFSIAIHCSTNVLKLMCFFFCFSGFSCPPEDVEVESWDTDERIASGAAAKPGCDEEGIDADEVDGMREDVES